MSERARAALRALAEKWAERREAALAAINNGTANNTWRSSDHADYCNRAAVSITALADDDALWVEPLVAADEEALAAGIREYASEEVLSDIGCSMLAGELTAAGVVQTRAQVVAALAEDEALPMEEPDPIGDIAESVGSVCDCSDPRSCGNCRRAASMIWMGSPGHREAWYGKQQRALGVAIKDVFWRAVQYGTTEDGDTHAYLITKGAMHRLIAAAQSAGISAAFRVSNDELPDAAALAAPADTGGTE